MTAIVTHLEARYGADEIRNNWYFEVWNEPSWMYTRGPAAYRLYQQHGERPGRRGSRGAGGRPGGQPAASPRWSRALIGFAKANSLKLDFISYHHYGNDDSPAAPPTRTRCRPSPQDVSLLKTNNFTGELLNTEFGSTYRAGNIRDDESSASFIAKTIALLGTDTPDSAAGLAGCWTMSDLYEEFDTGTATPAAARGTSGSC